MSHRKEIEALEDALEPLANAYIAYEQEVELATQYGYWLPSDDDALVAVPLGALRKVHRQLYPNFYTEPILEANKDEQADDLPF